MTLFSYEIFDAVARQGSFNKAAQQLHLTPSAISHAIAVMEEELGFALFNRGKNGVSMTSYGAWASKGRRLRCWVSQCPKCLGPIVGRHSC